MHSIGFKKKIHKTAPRKERVRKTFICSTCEKRFISGYALSRHMHTHTGRKPYQCEKCDKGFAQEANLKVHIQSIHNKLTHPCPICFKSISTKTNLNHHMKTHEYFPKVYCDRCDTYMKGDLSRHQQSKICRKKQSLRENSMFPMFG